MAGITDQNFNVKNTIEDFLKIEYTQGLINEFSTMDSLINKLKRDTLTGKYRHKAFALGITDNIRALGSSNDTYKLEHGDYTKGVEVVEAQFDTTKFMGIFSITDEAIMKGTTDGSIFDVVKDSLNRMQMGLKHTQNRYVYGSSTGKIGTVVAAADLSDHGTLKKATFKMTNSMSILPGMGILIDLGDSKLQGVIWQKENKTVGEENLVAIFDEKSATTWPASIPANAVVYARQLKISGDIAKEYTGLEDIVMTQDNKIFNVDRAVYTSLNPTIEDLNNGLLTESKLRDMADHIAVSSPEGSNINLVASNHKIISTIEKQLYQFKRYNMDDAKAGFNLGRPEIVFDTYVLHKDKYSRDKNVYMLDTNLIGELLRKDFAWITNGREGVLERINGTEIYEGIMTKYADMYIDGWKSQAAFKNAKEVVTA